MFCRYKDVSKRCMELVVVTVAVLIASTLFADTVADKTRVVVSVESCNSYEDLESAYEVAMAFINAIDYDGLESIELPDSGCIDPNVLKEYLPGPVRGFSKETEYLEGKDLKDMHGKNPFLGRGEARMGYVRQRDMHGDMVVIYIRDHGELGPAVLQGPNNLTPYGKEFCEPAEIRGYRATIARLPSPVETTVRIAVLVVERSIDWNKVLEAAKDGVRKGTRVWSCAARFTNSSIDGSELYTPPGSLEGPSFGDVIVDEITALDVPVQIAVSFAGPVWSGWEHWSMTFSISSCPAFPSFAAFPGPQAPPTSAQPIPLTMASFERDMLEADTLEAQILSRLGEYREDPDAQRVVAEFAQWFDECFTSSVAASRITNLMGQGPVPTFAPPEVPSGPVVDGKVIVSPVIFSDFEF